MRFEADFDLRFDTGGAAAVDRGRITKLRPLDGFAELGAGVEFVDVSFFADRHFAAGDAAFG